MKRTQPRHSPRFLSSGNDRPWLVAPRAHRRDSAWQALVYGEKVLPMEDGRGFWARLFGRG